ncbi:hypothetical protein BSKO_08939 [Bryopsis sp. KO-2023]|nr:hypothetical protein BSKO_08939 [Bryopsis sp. KO-2023]
MGNTLCVPIANRYRVPSCALCEKEAKKPFNKLSGAERRIWVFHEGNIYCTKCLITHRVEKFQKEKSSQFQKRVTEVVAERYVRPPRESALRKVLSGKAWDKSSSFKAPYVESPSVTEKLQRYSRSQTVSVQEKKISSTSGSPGSLDDSRDTNINRLPIEFADAGTDDANDVGKAWGSGVALKHLGDAASSGDDGDDSGCGSDCKEGDECEGEVSSGEANNACCGPSSHRRRVQELDSDGENNEDFDDDDADSCASESFEDLINHIEEKRRTKNFGAAGRFSFVIDDATEVESVDLLPATPRVENERQAVEAIR